MMENDEKRVVRGLFIDPFTGKAEAIGADLGSLAKIHALLGCDCFAIVGRALLGDGREFDVWHDDEGLLKGAEAMKVAVARFEMGTKRCAEQIFGRVFICLHDDMGEPVSLSESDMAALKGKLMRVMHICDGSRGYALIYEC